MIIAAVGYTERVYLTELHGWNTAAARAHRGVPSSTLAWPVTRAHLFR